MTVLKKPKRYPYEIAFLKWINKKCPNIKLILIKKYFMTCLRTGATLTQTFLLGLMIESIFYEKNVSKFLGQTILYTLVFLGYIFLTAKIAKESKKLQQEIYVKLRNLLFTKEIRANGKTLQAICSGENLQLFTQDIENIFTCLDNSLESVVVSLFGIIGITLIIGYYNCVLSLIILIIAIITVIITAVPNKKCQKARNLFRENHGNYINWINEYLKGMRDIHINQSEEMFKEIFNKKTVDNLKFKEKIRFIEIKIERVSSLISMLFTIIFWSISAYMIIYKSLTVGLFYVINTYFDNMIRYLSTVIQEQINIKNFIPSYDKVKYYCEIENEDEQSKNGESFYDKNLQNAFLKFINISFKYKDKMILSGLDAEFKEGKLNVVIGENGVGKTTLINLILRFYQAEDGYIEYSNQDIKKIQLREWRKVIGFVQQDTIFFEGSLRQNICLYAPNISEEEIWEILKISGLYETVIEWEDKIDTDILMGKRLSDGQKQRVAIARAIAKKPKIILMDEPTANLDYEIEKGIIKDIKKFCANQILIVITHRNSVVDQADKVFRIDGGKIRVEG